MENTLEEQADMGYYFNVKRNIENDLNRTFIAVSFILLSMATQATIAFTDFPHNMPGYVQAVSYEMKQQPLYSIPGYVVSFDKDSWKGV